MQIGIARWSLLALTAASLAGCLGDSDGGSSTPAPTATTPPTTTPTTTAPVATETGGFTITDVHGSAKSDEATRGPNNTANPWTTITSASVNSSGKLVVDFKVTTDAAGATAYTGTIPASALRFSISQLRAGDSTGDSNYWVTYVNSAKTSKGDSGQKPATYKMNQPGQETATTGTLTSTGTGTYSYVSGVTLTSGIDISANNTDTTFLPAGGKYAYNAAATHRVVIQMSDPDGTGSATMGANNASFDFVPDGKTAKMTNDVVDIANCNDGCHKTLGMHGGGRLDYKLCVTCHNPTNGDPESGNSLDLKVMAHKIHSAKYLPSVNFDFPGDFNGQYKTNPAGMVKGTPYKIWGHNNTAFDFSEALIPANPANCTVCHKNAADADNYKTKPTRQACGSCHDGIDFATGNGKRMWFPDSKITMAVGVGGTEVTRTDLTGFAAQVNAGHKGGAQSTNAACTLCHGSTGTSTVPDAMTSVTAAHGDFTNGWSKMKTDYTVDLTMSTPANGTHYVAGEKPKVTIVIKNAATGVAIDHTKITDDPATSEFGTLLGTTASPNTGPNGNAGGNGTTAGGNTGYLYGLSTTVAGGPSKGVSVSGALNLYVSGPRALKKPALTTVAANKSFFSLTGNIYGNAANDLRIRTGANAPMQDDVTSTKLTGVISRADASKIEYQLSSIPANMTSGTYVAFVQATKRSNVGVVPKAMSMAIKTFQIGQATEEKRVAFGCPECHSTTVWHDNAVNGINGNHPARFDPDYCGSCHDMEAQQVAYANGSGGGYKISYDSAGEEVFTSYTFSAGSGQAWYIGGNKFGYGTTPISRRVHAVHAGGIKRGNGEPMINYPYEIYSGHNVSIVFPQDVKNCEKCHNSQTSGTWKSKPSRLACLSCHDSDAAYAHAATQMIDPTPGIATASAVTTTPTSGPFNGDEVEACPVCHAAKK